MSANSFGNRFVISSFGESHGPALGVVVDGCPAGVVWNQNLLLKNLERRRPGSTAVVTARSEADTPEILSGVFEGKTLGTPIAMLVRNMDTRSADYVSISANPRLGHADAAWKNKFGHVDPRGGGRSSGRETVSRVMAGSVAQMFVQQCHTQVQVCGFSLKVGPFLLNEEERDQAYNLDVDKFPACFPSTRAEELEQILLKAKQDGESYGGVIELRIKNPPENLGQPVFHKLKADLSAAMMSVGAVNGVELGIGWQPSQIVNDRGTEFHQADQNSVKSSLRYGGIKGGISTGEDVFLRVHIKPTSSILDVAKVGRHDPYIGTRAIPVLESMIWLVLADHLLWSKTDRVSKDGEGITMMFGPTPV